jgi:hypothetical protein
MTRQEKTKKLILVIFLILVCSVLIRIYQTPSKEKNFYDKSENLLIETATLQINDKKYESKISDSTNIYDFMNQLKNEGKIDFKEKTYSGMGKFIDEINGLKNGEKNWIYYVNGQKANIGISNYKLNKGDIVSWRYESR